MSSLTNLAVMTAGRRDELLAALQQWARQHDRAADFARVEGPRMAAFANVIVGQVNYADVEWLQEVIRDAVHDPRWRHWQATAVTVMHEMDDGPRCLLLGADGTWR